jgi:transcriptional regulator with XRE-family HTH domain
MATMDSLSLKQAFETIQSRLEQQVPVLQRLTSPDLGAIRDFVQEVGACVDLLNTAAGVKEEPAALLRNSVISSSFPALLMLRREEPRAALSFLIEEWRRTADTLGEALILPTLESSGSEVRERRIPYGLSMEMERELLTLYNTAVFEMLLTTENQGRGRDVLRRLMTQLSLSYDQLGRAFGVSGETIRRWERGSHEIPADRMAVLVEAEAALRRLVTIFRPERLAQVLRRKTGLFGDESGLDWIFRGRMTDVADRYEMALSYQG